MTYPSPTRILQIWKDHKAVPETNEFLFGSVFFCFGIVDENGSKRLYPSYLPARFNAENYVLVDDYCQRLYAAASDEGDPFQKLDNEYSDLVSCRYLIGTGISDDEAAVNCARNLLIRLPAVPPEPVLTSKFPSSQDTEPRSHERFETVSEPTTTQWTRNPMVSNFSTNVIRLALNLTQGNHHSPNPRNLRRFVNATADLLVRVVELTAEAAISADAEKERIWMLVQAFLWSSWQRVTMLFFWHILRHPLEEIGERYEDEFQYLTLQGTNFTREVLRKGTKSSFLYAPPYMCKWAFQLLKSDRASATLDLRRYIDRFNALVGNRAPRCVGTSQCNGKSPEHCMRFKGATIEDQSAHDSKYCRGPDFCHRLHWDKRSYEAVTGARAVCIRSTGDTLLKYCPTSETTMAISHVWSHGQGGRPEEKLEHEAKGGMNACLHQRYAVIASEVGCDSYWMDTPCIPEDHQLREEQISFINGVFANSSITLVCDRDLMEIDISKIQNSTMFYKAGRVKLMSHIDPEDLHIRESILVLLLVCDWNIRAWTLLEAMKGRYNVYLLCRDNRIIGLRETLEIVFYHGAVDIAILYLGALHLLPLPTSSKESRRIDVSLGLITLEEAGTLLSHRHASREGDDVVIWSLLFSESGKPFKTAESLWRQQLDGTEYGLVNSAFLVSSAPRIENVPGLSWAPRTPAVHVTAAEEAKGQRAHPAAALSQVFALDITPDGLFGGWWVYKFARKPSYGVQSDSLEDITELYLQSFDYGILLQPMIENQASEIADTPYRSNSDGPLVAVCGSSDLKGPWLWRGVYEWKIDDPFPELEVEIILIS